MKAGLIYKAINKANGKGYIGQTIQSLCRRKSQHKCESKRRNSPFAYAIRKYGIDGFEWIILYNNVDIEKLDDMEKQSIDEEKTLVDNGFGYNSESGGNRN